MRRVRRFLALALIATLALPALASALSVAEVARELRCPTCNQALDVSHSPAAEDMKRFIAARIDEGWDKQRIIDAMVDDFGEQVLATPPKAGFGLVVWTVPAAATVLGLVAVPFVARGWRRRRAAAPVEPPQISPEERRRIDSELERLEP